MEEEARVAEEVQATVARVAEGRSRRRTRAWRRRTQRRRGVPPGRAGGRRRRGRRRRPAARDARVDNKDGVGAEEEVEDGEAGSSAADGAFDGVAWQRSRASPSSSSSEEVQASSSLIWGECEKICILPPQIPAK